MRKTLDGAAPDSFNEQLAKHEGMIVTCECGVSCQISKPTRVGVA